MSFSPHVEREILSAMIDGELSADERRWVHDHLQTCAECRDAVEEFGHVHGLVGELPRLVAPIAFLNDVLQPPPSETRSVAKALSGRRRWAAVGLAAIAAAITLAGLVVPPEAEEPPVAVYIERHVGVHSNEESGAQVLTAVNGR